MDPAAVVNVFAVGAGLLAFWAVARYPRFGPQTLGAAFLVLLVAFAPQIVTIDVATSVTRSAGAPAALLFVVLPCLTVAFWAAGCLFRSLVAELAPRERLD